MRRQNEHEAPSSNRSRSIPSSLGNYIELRSKLSLYPWRSSRRGIRIREPQKMTQTDFFTLYFASLGVIAGLAGFVITHLLAEINRLSARVDEIYNILLER